MPSRSIVTKACSISRVVLALRTSIDNPMARAVSCARGASTLNVTTSLGFVSMAKRLVLRHQLMQQFQPLRHRLIGGEIHTGHITARPIEARDETKPDRV